MPDIDQNIETNVNYRGNAEDRRAVVQDLIIARGYRISQVAATIGVSATTIRNDITTIYSTAADLISSEDKDSNTVVKQLVRVMISTQTRTRILWDRLNNISTTRNRMVELLQTQEGYDKPSAIIQVGRFERELLKDIREEEAHLVNIMKQF